MPDRELLLEQLERLAIVLDELMPQCAELVRDAIALLKEQNDCENCAIAIEDRQHVVRCKDCKDACICSDDWVICTHIDSNGNDKHPIDWYCADGEKR